MFLLTIIHTLILAFLTLYFCTCYHDGDNPFEFPPRYTKWKYILWGVLSGEAIFLIQGGLHIFDIVDFDTYFHFVLAIPYLVIGVALLILFIALWVVHYRRKKQIARTTPDHAAIQTALEAGRISEAMRLYKAVNCLNKEYVNDALRRVLTNSPVENAIRSAINELLALQRDIADAFRLGAPQELTSKLTEESENMLNKILKITDRVVTVRKQNIDSPRIQEALHTQKERIQNLNNIVCAVRENLAAWNIKGWDSEDLDKALQNLNNFLAELRKQFDSDDG